MIPIYICDDNEAISKHINTIIKNAIMIQNYDMDVVLITKHPEAIIKAKQVNKEQSIYFFDVDLQHYDYDGFTLTKEIRSLDPGGFIIFVTTHEELIFETFKYRLEAMAYISKDKMDEMSIQIRNCLDEIQTLISKKEEHGSYYTVKNRWKYVLNINA